MPSSIGNLFMKTIINSPLHPLMGDKFAVISVTGRKTGSIYSTPINILDVNGKLTVISLRERTWWKNLRAGRKASLSHAGKRYTIRAEIVDKPSDVASGLLEYFEHYPKHAKYFGIQKKPDGEFNLQDLECLAGERVLIRLHPEK